MSEHTEDKYMAYSSGYGGFGGGVGLGDVATLGLLGGIGGVGRGRGDSRLGFGDEVLAAKAHANGTADVAKIDAIQSAQHTASINGRFDRLNENISDSEFRTGFKLDGITKDLADAEFRSIDRQRDIERVLDTNARDAAKCCCETQALVIAEGNRTRELVLAVEGRGVVAQLHEAQSKINQLETINELQYRGRG